MTVAMSGTNRTTTRRSWKTPLSPGEVARLRRAPLYPPPRARDEVDRVEADFLQPSGATRGQPEDESMEENELDVELRALAVEDELGYEVSEALDRVSEETFGLCGTCGESISARGCSSCRTPACAASALERPSERPAARVQPHGPDGSMRPGLERADALSGVRPPTAPTLRSGSASAGGGVDGAPVGCSSRSAPQRVRRPTSPLVRTALARLRRRLRLQPWSPAASRWSKVNASAIGRRGGDRRDERLQPDQVVVHQHGARRALALSASNENGCCWCSPEVQRLRWDGP